MSNTVEIKNEFTFRQNKDTGYKRPSLELSYSVPSAEGIIAILAESDNPAKELILSNVQDIVTKYLRSAFVDGDEEFTQDSLVELEAEGKLTLEAIASIPRAERNTLSKDDLEAFAKDYIRYIPEITGKTEAKVKAAAGLFVERFKRVAGDQNVLSILQDQLAIFVDKVPEEVAGQHEKAITYFTNKLSDLLDQNITADSLL